MTIIIGLAEQQQARSGLAGWLPAASGCAGRRMVVVAAESVCLERACWPLADIAVSLARPPEGSVGPNSPTRLPNDPGIRAPSDDGVRELPECPGQPGKRRPLVPGGPRVTGCGHDPRRPARGGTAPPGHCAPARPGAVPADPAE